MFFEPGKIYNLGVSFNKMNLKLGVNANIYLVTQSKQAIELQGCQA